MDARQVVNDVAPVTVADVGAVALAGNAGTSLYGEQSGDANHEDRADGYGVAHSCRCHVNRDAGGPHRAGMIQRGIMGKLAALAE